MDLFQVVNSVICAWSNGLYTVLGFLVWGKVTQVSQVGINLYRWKQPSVARCEGCLFCSSFNQLCFAVSSGHLLCQTVMSSSVQLLRFCRKAVVSLHLFSVYGCKWVCVHTHPGLWSKSLSYTVISAKLFLQLYEKFNLKEIHFYIVPLTRADFEYVITNITLPTYKNREAKIILSFEI